MNFYYALLYSSTHSSIISLKKKKFFFCTMSITSQLTQGLLKSLFWLISEKYKDGKKKDVTDKVLRCS